MAGCKRWACDPATQTLLQVGHAADCPNGVCSMKRLALPLTFLTFSTVPDRPGHLSFRHPFLSVRTQLQCFRTPCTPRVQTTPQVPCQALCRPRALTPLSAALSTDGRTLTLALSAPAAPLPTGPCAAAAVFDSPSSALLGEAAASGSGSGSGAGVAPGAQCATSADALSLVVQLPPTATVAVGFVVVVVVADAFMGMAVHMGAGEITVAHMLAEWHFASVMR